MRLQEKIIYGKLMGDIPLHGMSKEMKDTTNNDLPSDIVSFDTLNGAISKMDITKENYAYRPIFSCRKWIGSLIVFFKKVVRKCLKWYIEPICFQQTDFNNAAVSAIRQLRIAALRMEEMEQQYQELVARAEKVEADVAQMRAEMDTCEDRLGMLTVEHNGRLDRLESRMNDFSAATARSSAMLDQLHAQGAFLATAKNEAVMRLSASQSGEDRIISYILSAMGIPEEDCVYLDLGANHAKYLSNTYSLYQKGARGVLVEANPALISELKLFRGDDVILNRCISTAGGEFVPFYILSGDGLSTPNKDEAEEAVRRNPSLSITKVEQVETITANEVLEQHFETAPKFLNIDIEGGNLEVLESIDFEKYRPLIISVETIPYRPHLVVGEKVQAVVDFMAKQDYVEYAFTGINSIFLDKRQVSEVLE